MKILLTGGTGYIGSHTATVLHDTGHEIFIYDNLINSNKEVISQLQKITGAKFYFKEGDIRDTNLLTKEIKKNGIEAVIHFAGLKAVGESMEKPLDYFEVNVGGTISLLRAMYANNVNYLVFSSSATVYGQPNYLPIDEKHLKVTTNTYGQTKLQVENILEGVCKRNKSLKTICLRYFNPVGAHESALIGENPNGIPNNLMPYVSLVAAEKLPFVKVFGDDYETPDGTGIRDYIHIMDLVKGHLSALEFILDSAKSLNSVSIKKPKDKSNFSAFNVGTGKGFSVLEIIETFQKISKKKIPYQITSRRKGDIAESYADVKRANHELGWKADKDLEDMCSSTWNFQKRISEL